MFHGEEAIDAGGVRKVILLPHYLNHLWIQAYVAICFRWFFWARKRSMTEEWGRLEASGFLLIACCVVLILLVSCFVEKLACTNTILAEIEAFFPFLGLNNFHIKGHALAKKWSEFQSETTIRNLRTYFSPLCHFLLQEHGSLISNNNR